MRVLATACVLVMFALAFCHADDEAETTTQYAGEIITPAEASTDVRTLKPRKGSKSKANCRAKGRKGVIEVSDGEGFASDKTVTMQLHSINEVGMRPERPDSVEKRDVDNVKGEKKRDFDKLKSGRNNFKSFDNQNFQLGEAVENDTYPGTAISVSSMSFSAVLKKNFNKTEITVGIVNLTLYVFHESAELNVSGELSTFTEGSVKVNLVAEKFVFCSNESSEVGCDNENGAALDVTFAMRGKGGRKLEKAKRRPKEKLEPYGLGGKAAIRMSRMLEVDGTPIVMDEGFPELENKGPISLITCRLNKFSDKVFYDPIIDLELSDLVLEDDGDKGVGDDDGKGDGNGGVTPQLNVLLLMGFCLTISRMVFVL